MDVTFEEMIFKDLIRNGTKFFLSVKDTPNESILESVYQMRLRDSKNGGRVSLRPSLPCAIKIQRKRMNQHAVLA